VAKSERILCLGLDGCSWKVLKPWMDKGKLPQISKLVEAGISGDLLSTYPPNTAPAWSSFMTGKNPGKHGIFDLSMLNKKELSEYPATSQCLKGQTLWEILSDHGKSVMVMSIPVSYPLRKVNGVLIGDFLTPKGARNFTHPPELLDELESRFGPYRLHYNQVYTKRNVGNVIQEAYDVLEYQSKVADYLLKKQKWDFMAIHFFGTDRLQHELWHLMDPDHPAYEERVTAKYGEKLSGFFTALDQSLSQLIETAGEDVHIALLSDHGFGPTHHYLTINNWLIEEGYLRFKKGAWTKLKSLFFRAGITPDLMYKLAMNLGMANFRQSGGLGTRHHIFQLLYLFFLSLQDVDWKHTKAYSKGNFGQIFLNVKDREPHGIINMGEPYKSVREEIIAKLKKLTVPGSSRLLLDPVFRREDIYTGDNNEAAPDIFFLPADMSYKALGTMDFISNRFIQKSFGHSGDHRMEGILALCGPHFQKTGFVEQAEIMDLAPTILYLLGLPIPEDMDGRVLSDVFVEDFTRDNPKRTDSSHRKREEEGENLSDSELSEIKKNLKALGYMG